MRQMILLMHLTPEQEVLWHGRFAMVVALDDAEAVVFRHNINAVDDVLKHQTKALATLREVFETEGDKEGRAVRIIADMQEISRDAEVAMNVIRMILGRAAFIGPQEAQGVMQ
jgi:aspartate carbamoyltransferase catalytic subunit